MSLAQIDNVGFYEKGFPFVFPAGEVQVRMVKTHAKSVEINLVLKGSDDVISLLLTVDALRRDGVEGICLTLPYVPYSRQDRVMVSGEALSIKVFADLLNYCKFDSVEIWDPHSDVTSALINNVKVISQAECVIGHQHLLFKLHEGQPSSTILVCPDAGARKKIHSVARLTGIHNILYADKNRDPGTGKISGTSLNWDSIPSWTEEQSLGKEPIRFFICDDICEGGYTFVELAKEIKLQTGDALKYEIYLYVTHGFFSKGLEELNKHFEGVYVANLMSTDPAVVNSPLIITNKE